MGFLTTVNLRYAGQYYDSETGLFYNCVNRATPPCVAEGPNKSDLP